MKEQDCKYDKISFGLYKKNSALDTILKMDVPILGLCEKNV